MTAQNPATMYVLRRRVLTDDSRYTDFVFLDRETGMPVAGDEMGENPNNFQPAHFAFEKATEVAATFNKDLTDGDTWTLQVAPNPCASCGRVLWANDRDFCHPNDREQTSWRAGCNEHDFGCGFEVEADTWAAVMAKWNSATLFEYPSEEYSQVERKGRKLLEIELTAAFATTDGPVPLTHIDFLKRVEALSKEPAHSLHYVARHYLALCAVRPW